VAHFSNSNLQKENAWYRIGMEPHTSVFVVFTVAHDNIRFQNRSWNLVRSITKLPSPLQCSKRNEKHGAHEMFG
jgi:hypothetical protein